MEDWMLENMHIVPSDDSEPDILLRFREAAGQWARRDAGGADTILLACNLLVEGFDTPSLRDVASLPVGAEWWESRDSLKAAFEELGYDVLVASEESRLLMLRWLCLAFLRGALATEAFLWRVRGLFEGEPPEVAFSLAYLIYAFDSDERELDAAEAAELTVLAEEDARVFIAATSDD